MVALLLLVLLATAALTVVMKRSDPANDRDLSARQLTVANLARVETALATFAMQNRRLPCPASGLNVASQTQAEMGVERRLVFTYASASYEVCQVAGLTNTSSEGQKSIILSQQFQTNGVVPWRTLGLKRSEAMDGWGNLLTYRVFPELVKSNVLDLTSCHPNGTGPLASGGNETGRCKSCQGNSMENCTPPGAYTLGKGLKVVGPGGQTLMDPSGSASTNNGAAYVVISHGENGAGAFSASGVAQAGRPAPGTNEASNAVTTQFSAPFPSFYDSSPSQTEGANYFDDLLLRPRIVDVANAASLGPRMR